MTIFDYLNYRDFLRDFFGAGQARGRGKISKIAKTLKVHTTFISLVFKEERELSLEQAVVLGKEMALTEGELEYFLHLVQLSRCGNQLLKTHTLKKIKAMQETNKKLSKHYEHEKQLDAETRQIFYSSWHYSAIRILVSIKNQGLTIEELSSHMQLPRQILVEALHFLVGAQLIKKIGDRYLVGPQRTFLERGKPLLKCHLSNWRLRGLQLYEQLTDDEIMFTTTLSLSVKDFHKLRGIITEFIATTSKVIETTEPERAACVNIDLFWLR